MRKGIGSLHRPTISHNSRRFATFNRRRPRVISSRHSCLAKVDENGRQECPPYVFFKETETLPARAGTALLSRAQRGAHRVRDSSTSGPSKCADMESMPAVMIPFAAVSRHVVCTFAE